MRGVDRKGDREASVGYEAANVKPDKDLVLYYRPGDDVGITC